MAIVGKDGLSGFDYGKDGLPFVRVLAKSGIDTLSFDYGKDGLPFVVAGAAGSTPPPDPDPEPTVAAGYIMVVMSS